MQIAELEWESRQRKVMFHAKMGMKRVVPNHGLFRTTYGAMNRNICARCACSWCFGTCLQEANDESDWQVDWFISTLYPLDPPLTHPLRRSFLTIFTALEVRCTFRLRSPPVPTWTSILHSLFPLRRRLHSIMSNTCSLSYPSLPLPLAPHPVRLFYNMLDIDPPQSCWCPTTHTSSKKYHEPRSSFRIWTLTWISRKLSRAERLTGEKRSQNIFVVSIRLSTCVNESGWA